MLDLFWYFTKPVFFLLSEYATYDLVFLKDRKYGN